MNIFVLLVYGFFGFIVLVPVVLLIGVFLFPAIKKYQLTQKLKQSGVSAPAEILASKLNFSSKSSYSGYSYNVSFDLQVKPTDAPAFQTKFTTFVHSPEEELIRPGKLIWVRYDPNDISKMAFEYFNSEKMMLLEEDEWKKMRDAYEALEKRYQILRASGEEALATIIEKQEIFDVSTGMGKATIYRLKFDITPNSVLPFQAETQAAMQINKKYEVGRKVFVRFDRIDPTMVALERSAESIW